MVQVQLTSRIRSGDQSGVAAGFVVATDVTSSAGEVVLHRGAPVDATIRVANPRGFGRAGGIAVDVHAAQTREGSAVRLRGDTRVRGRRRTGVAVGLGFGLMPLLGPFAWFFFGKKGWNTAIEQGAIIPCVVY